MLDFNYSYNFKLTLKKKRIRKLLINRVNVFFIDSNCFDIKHELYK